MISKHFKLLFAIASFGLSACGGLALKGRGRPAPAPTAATATETPAEKAPAAPPAPAKEDPNLQSHSEPKIEIKPIAKKEEPKPKDEPAEVSVSEKPQPPTHTAAPSAGHAAEKIEGVEPEQSLRWLQNGNTRFRKGFLRKDGQSKADVSRLAKGQKPHAIILSCSDSRVPPEIVFDQKLGEIFVIRTAGEALDDNAIGSIEYAVEHLGSRLLVVMGHTSCGAVKAAIQTIKGADAGSPALNHLVADIHPRIREALAAGAPASNVERESWANAAGVAQDLVKRSAILRDAVEKGHLLIKPALYDLDSGEVKW
jgi:carbonic anhydrase